MTFVSSFHFLMAFLVALCALVFSWNAMGRRVVSVVLGIQILVGLALAGTFAAAHRTFPSVIGLHVGAALGAAVCYGIAGAMGRRAGRARGAVVFAILGLLLVAVAVGYGMNMYFHG
ncbi:MAG TPA: hypothetical protein VMF61_08980 [Candidatus Acidoferrales bacterium]|nr:hypothetical protein [Candidatus Acidoferrales bacterium]